MKTPENSLLKNRAGSLSTPETCVPLAQCSAQWFYLENRLSAEVKGQCHRSVFHSGSHVLAQLNSLAEVSSVLIASDSNSSILETFEAGRVSAIAYTPYGYTSSGEDVMNLPGFNGERADPVTGCYLLGNGYRSFNPVLRRFNSPDSWSPFGRGGMNAYAYCLGDPVNHDDRSGHSPFGSLFRGLRSLLGLKRRASRMAGVGKPGKSAASPWVHQASQGDKSGFIGFHGTSEKGARGLLKKGAVSKSKGDSFFVTNTFASANEYASIQPKGAVVSVYTTDISKLHSLSTRSVVKQSNIEQLKIPRGAHASLRFERVSDGEVSSNFNRFMSEQESAAYWITRFRQQH